MKARFALMKCLLNAEERALNETSYDKCLYTMYQKTMGNSYCTKMHMTQYWLQQ